jgi:hypothetical protein
MIQSLIRSPVVYQEGFVCSMTGYNLQENVNLHLESRQARPVMYLHIQSSDHDLLLGLVT